jgi:hypothetical protein
MSRCAAPELVRELGLVTGNGSGDRTCGPVPLALIDRNVDISEGAGSRGVDGGDDMSDVQP